MSIGDVLNLGLGANLLELHYRSGIEGYKKDPLLSLIDIPQHLVAGAIASTVFGGPMAMVVFGVLPLTCKAIDLCTKKGSNLNKIASTGDHLMRLASKITIITASFSNLLAVPLYSLAHTWAFTRTCILLYSFVKDASLTATYGLAGSDCFETTIHLNYKFN